MSEKLALALVGQSIDDGWTIDGVRSRCAGATGACHALGFTATHADGRRAFVKVLDPSMDPHLEGREQLKEFKRRLDVFVYEGDLLEKCLTRRIKRVVRSLGQGSVRLDGFPNDVHYLMFELADRDLREHATLEKTLDAALNLRILHQVALALEALHFNQISHQDLKPSNVLLFGELLTKLGDLGHAHDRGIPRPGTNGVLAGDPVHAPLEQLYGFELTDWTTRRLASDLYLLGSLAVFMFTNVSLTTQVGGQLRPEHHWEAWPSGYEDVLPYVYAAWDAALDDFAELLAPAIQDELVALTRYLTEPDPTRRGHPRSRARGGNAYGIRRFSSRFEVLAKIAERALSRERAA